MQLGVLLAHLGPDADEVSVRAAARAADVLGYHSVWVVAPSLGPGSRVSSAAALTSAASPGSVRPSAVMSPSAVSAAIASVPSGGSTGGVGVGPVRALVLAAQETERVLLGIHVPLADTVGIDNLHAHLGMATERLIIAVDADVDVDPAGDGGHAPSEAGTVARSLRRPPAQVFAAGAVGGPAEQIAAGVDGWLVTRSPLDGIRGGWARIAADAERAGRDPGELSLVVRADVELTAGPLSRHRSTFCGSVDQVVDDLVAVAAAGVHVTVLAFPAALPLDAVLGGYAAIAEGLELRSLS